MDVYKLYMQQVVFYCYGDVYVVVEFCCCGDDLFGIYVDVICEQVEFMCDLRLWDDEYCWLFIFFFFCQDYFNWLCDFCYDLSQVMVSNDNGKLNICFIGLWWEVIMWEVLLLVVISELVYCYCLLEMGVDQVFNMLEYKLGDFVIMIVDFDMSVFCLMDFGICCCFLCEVQEGIVWCLQQELWFVGISNYDLVCCLNLILMGIQVYEWFQVYQQISFSFVSSQWVVFVVWLEEYFDQLGIVLIDCIIMDVFLCDFGLEFVICYQGLCYDFGDLVEWGEKVIVYYQKLGIDLLSKVLVFFDNFDLVKVVDLYCYFVLWVKFSFGIGICLICDLLQVKLFNIVIKLVECNGKLVVKFFDSLGKIICYDKVFVCVLCEVFDLLLIKKVS